MGNPNFSGYDKKTRAVAVSVAVASLLVYLPALWNGFVNRDDGRYIYENPDIRHFDARLFKWAFTSFHVSNWHPLTWLSHAADYAIWGLNPLGHHLSSILLHALNTFLVVILSVRLIRLAAPRREEDGRRGALIAGAITGLLFGLHPLHVESVAWVSERKDVLCAFFFLLSILKYLNYADPGQGSKRGHYAASLTLFALALMSKPMAVSLPVVLLILDVYPLERLQWKAAFTSQRRVLLEKVPFVLLSAASSVVTLMAQKKTIVVFKTLPLGERILNSIRTVVFYLLKMVWPSKLAPLYPYPREMSLFTLEYMGACIAVAGMTGFCIWAFRRWKAFPAAWAYYIVSLIPVLGIVQVGIQSAADRYTYLPSLGPMILVGLGYSRAWGKVSIVHNRTPLKTGLAALPVFVICLLSSLTVKQISIWKNPQALWDYEANVFPHNPEALICRGDLYYKEGDFKKALEYYDTAVKAAPDYPDGYGARGKTYLMLGNYNQAILDFDKTIELKPQDEEALFNRSLAYQSAIKDYSRSISMSPREIELYIDRGASFAAIGEYDKALEDFNTAIKLNPRFATAYYNRGLLHRDMGNYREAIADFQAAARLGDAQAQDLLKSNGIGW